MAMSLNPLKWFKKAREDHWVIKSVVACGQGEGGLWGYNTIWERAGDRRLIHYAFPTEKPVEKVLKLARADAANRAKNEKADDPPPGVPEPKPVEAAPTPDPVIVVAPNKAFTLVRKTPLPPPKR